MDLETVTFLLLLSFTFANGQFNNNIPPERVIYSVNGRIRGFSNTGDSDVVLGGIMPIHSTQGGGLCSDDIYLESVDYVEAFLYSLDSINNDSSLLPNTTLGYDIRDSCLNVDVAVEEVVDLSLGSSQLEDNCVTSADADNQTDSVPISAIIGEQVSFVSIPVASFLSIAGIPQISYLSTSVLLNDRTAFPYFYRTVPSDDQQAQAMIDVALRFSWTFVSAVHSNDLYGDPGMNRFRELAVKHDICLGVDRGIDSSYAPSDYQLLVNELVNSTANVIVLFSSLQQAVTLFDYMKDVDRHFLWLTSDAVSYSPVVFPKYNSVLSGSWSILPLTKSYPGFFEYYSKVTIQNNKRNPWFKQYHNIFYDCVDSSCAEFNASITDSPRYLLNQNTPLVIDAVYTFAYALNAFIFQNCDQPITWNPTTRTCIGQKKELNGPTFQPYLANVNFTSPTGNHIVFKDTGSIDGRYRVSSYHLDDSGQYDFVDVGVWDGNYLPPHQLQLNKSKLELLFGANDDGEIMSTVESHCELCPLGNVKSSNALSCCGTCSTCLGQNYANSSTSTNCTLCPYGMWGNNPLNGSNACIEVDKLYESASDGVGIFVILISCVLSIAAVIITVILVYRWNTDTVNTLSRFNLIVMIITVFVSTLSIIFFITEPSTGMCLFQRIIGWICFSFVISPLLVIQIRITWTLAMNKGYVKRTFVDSLYQLIITFILILSQLVLTVVSLLVVHPAVVKDMIYNAENDNNYPQLHLMCVSSNIIIDIISTCYQTFLLISFIVLSIVTFKVSDNLKEAKFTALSALILNIVWVGFVVAYFVVDNEFKPIPVSITIQINCLIMLVCFLIPRVLLGFKSPSNLNRQNKDIDYSIRSIDGSNYVNKTGTPKNKEETQVTRM